MGTFIDEGQFILKSDWRGLHIVDEVLFIRKCNRDGLHIVGEDPF